MTLLQLTEIPFLPTPLSRGPRRLNKFHARFCHNLTDKLLLVTTGLLSTDMKSCVKE